MAALLGAALATAACGAGVGGTSSGAAPGVGGTSSAAASGPVSASAAPGAGGAAGSSASTSSAASGGAGVSTQVSHGPGSLAVGVTVTLTGPAVFEGGCLPTLQVWLLDSQGRVLAQPNPSAGALHCLAISEEVLPAGRAQAFSATLVAPAPGVYRVTGSLRGVGAVPGVSITV